MYPKLSMPSSSRTLDGGVASCSNISAHGHKSTGKYTLVPECTYAITHCDVEAVDRLWVVATSGGYFIQVYSLMPDDVVPGKRIETCFALWIYHNMASARNRACDVSITNYDGGVI